MEKSPKPFPYDERPTVTSAEIIWQERISTMQFYHGTSEKALDKIRTNGISFSERPYAAEDLILLSAIQQAATGYTDYYLRALANSRDSYVGTDLARCTEYAVVGSEVVGEILRVGEELLENRAADLARIQTIEDPFGKLSLIKQRVIDYLCSHRPALVRINRNSAVLQEVLARDLPEIYPLIFDKRAFVQEAKKLAQESGIDEENAANILENRIGAALADVPIDRVIPPNDLGFITGDDFYCLSDELKSRRRIIDTFLYDFDKLPPDLIGVVGNVVSTNIRDTRLIVEVCLYYGISPEQTELLLHRIE